MPARAAGQVRPGDVAANCFKRCHPAAKGQVDAAAGVGLARIWAGTAVADDFRLRNLLGARKHAEQLLQEDYQ